MVRSCIAAGVICFVLAAGQAFAQDLELLRAECLSNSEFHDPNACFDEPVAYRSGQTEYTCEDQRSFGNCEESWMSDNGYCKATCGGCTLSDQIKVDESLCVTNIVMMLSDDPRIQDALDNRMNSLQDCNAEKLTLFLPTSDALLRAQAESENGTPSLIRGSIILDTLDRVSVPYYDIPLDDGAYTVTAIAGNELLVTVDNGEITQVQSSTDGAATDVNKCAEACNGRVCSVDLFI